MGIFIASAISERLRQNLFDKIKNVLGSQLQLPTLFGTNNEPWIIHKVCQTNRVAFWIDKNKKLFDTMTEVLFKFLQFAKTKSFSEYDRNFHRIKVTKDGRKNLFINFPANLK